MKRTMKLDEGEITSPLIPRDESWEEVKDSLKFGVMMIAVMGFIILMGVIL